MATNNPKNQLALDLGDTTAKLVAARARGVLARGVPTPKPRDPWRLPTAHGWSRHPRAVEKPRSKRGGGTVRTAVHTSVRIAVNEYPQALQRGEINEFAVYEGVASNRS